jgi:hypothetical protein
MKSITKSGDEWSAHLTHEGEVINFGPFATEEAAARKFSTARFEHKGGIIPSEPGSWLAKLVRHGKTTDLGVFVSLQAATTALNTATLLANRQHRNQKARESRIVSTDQLPTAAQLAKRQLRNQKDRASRTVATRQRGSSQYRGVDREGDRWRVRLLAKVVGRYDNELEAAHAYDDAARERRNQRVTESRERRNQRVTESRGSSQYRGVDREGDRWRVRLLAKVVGRYDNELDAAHAYDDAARERYGDDAVVNFSLDFTPTTQQDRARHPPHSRFDFTADERGSEDHLTWSEIVA